MKPLRLQRWGSQILPLTTKQPSLVARQPIQFYSARWQTTVADAKPEKDGSLKRKRATRKAPPASTPLPASIDAAAEPMGTSSLPLPSSPPPPPSIPKPGITYGCVHRATQKPMNPFHGSPISNFQPSSLSSLPEVSTALPTSDAIPFPPEKLPSPPIAAARSSAKLAALHSRLRLPTRFPIETLARTLIDKSADRNRNYNNHSFSILGNDLLGYYMGEYLLCQYPRLPMAVLSAALYAYVGHTSLAEVAKDWGVEVAAEPGGEVNPGLLQFRHIIPGTPFNVRGAAHSREVLGMAPTRRVNSDSSTPTPDAENLVTTLESASATFVRAVFGALYMHAGADVTYEFFKSHILSRQLDIASLFTFTQPNRDLSRLCAREGFESPIARVISETGRLSRVPVFVVGVFSGRDKLGEAAGSSLNEARFKASVHALKGWYLYSPKGRTVAGEVLVPSMMEGLKGQTTTWIPAHIDDGEVVV